MIELDRGAFAQLLILCPSERGEADGDENAHENIPVLEPDLDGTR